MCCNRRDVVKHGRDKVAKDKRLSMLAWKYGLEDCRPKEERGRSESNLEPLPFLLGAHHSNYTWGRRGGKGYTAGDGRGTDEADAETRSADRGGGGGADG